MVGVFLPAQMASYWRELRVGNELQEKNTMVGEGEEFPPFIFVPVGREHGRGNILPPAWISFRILFLIGRD